MSAFRYTEHDGHFVAEVPAGNSLRRWLIDTGSPGSVSNTPLHIDGEQIEVADNFMGINIDELQSMVGCEFDTLVGMDVLGGFSIQIDSANKQLHLLKQEPEVTGHRLPFRLVMGIPTVDMNITGTDCSLFFDTGAKITYLQKGLFDGQQPVREIEDFYPGFGPFTAAVYEVPADIAGEMKVIEAAALPDLLEATLLAVGTQGILGNSAWTDRSCVLLKQSYELVIS